MSNLPDSTDPRRLRASDADRDRVAAQLRDAAGEGRITLAEVEERLEGVYAARTYADLERFIDDLPAAGADRPQPATPTSRSADSSARSRVGGTPGSKISIAVMSGVTRKRGWVAPPTHTAFAFWGGVDIDLREARFAEQETTIWAFAVMGGVEIIVPDDIDVVVDGFGIMGAFEDNTAGANAPVPGDQRPLVRVRGFAFWGGVEIKMKARRERRHESGQPPELGGE